MYNSSTKKQTNGEKSFGNGRKRNSRNQAKKSDTLRRGTSSAKTTVIRKGSATYGRHTYPYEITIDQGSYLGQFVGCAVTLIVRSPRLDGMDEAMYNELHRYINRWLTKRGLPIIDAGNSKGANQDRYGAVERRKSL